MSLIGNESPYSLCVEVPERNLDHMEDEIRFKLTESPQLLSFSLPLESIFTGLGFSKPQLAGQILLNTRFHISKILYKYYHNAGLFLKLALLCCFYPYDIYSSRALGKRIFGSLG